MEQKITAAEHKVLLALSTVGNYLKPGLYTHSKWIVKRLNSTEVVLTCSALTVKSLENKGLIDNRGGITFLGGFVSVHRRYPSPEELEKLTARARHLHNS